MYAPICATVAPREAESDPSTRTRRKWAFPWFSPANGRNRLTNRDDRDLVCVCVRWVHDGWGWFISDGRIIMMTAIIARHPSLFRRGEAMSFPRWQPVRVVRLRRIRRICVRCEAVGLSWTCSWAAQMEWDGSMAVSVRSVMMDGAFDREARKREIFPTIILSFRWAFVTGWGLSFRLQSCRNGKGKSILLHSETETV